MEEPSELCGQGGQGVRLVVAPPLLKSGCCLDDPAYALIARRVNSLERGLLASLEQRGLIPSTVPGTEVGAGAGAGAGAAGSGKVFPKGDGQGMERAEEMAHLGPIVDGLSHPGGQGEVRFQEHEKEQGQEHEKREGHGHGQENGQEKSHEKGQEQGQEEGEHLQELMGSVGAPAKSPKKPPEKLPRPEIRSDQPADGQVKRSEAGQAGDYPEGSAQRSHHVTKHTPGQLLHNLIDRFQPHRVPSDGQQKGKLSGQSPGQSRRHSENGQVAGKDGDHGSRRSQESAHGQSDGQVQGQLKKSPSKGHLKWFSKASDEEASEAQHQNQNQHPKQNETQNKKQDQSQSQSHHFGLWHHHNAPPAPGSLLGTPRFEEFYSVQQALGNGHLGAVNVCRCKATRRLYACKTIQKSELKNARHVEEVKMEVLGMAQMELRGGTCADSGTVTGTGTDTGTGTGTETGAGLAGGRTSARAAESPSRGDGVQHVVRLYEVFDDAEVIHLITDHCEGGDLLHYVVSRGRLPEKECAAMVVQLAMGLAAMHRAGLLHRDIKPENILLTKKERHEGTAHDKEGPPSFGRGWGVHLPHAQHHLPTHPPTPHPDPHASENGSSHLTSILQATHPHSHALGLGHAHGHTQGGQQLDHGSGSQHHRRGFTFLVGDFGSCVQFRAGEPVRGLVGSPKYMAPEVIKGEGYAAGVDVWSLGVVLYSCLAGRQPFTGERVEEVFERVCESEPDLARPPWNCTSPEAKSLVAAMLTKDPQKRISLQGVLHHTWIQQHCRAPGLGPRSPSKKAAVGQLASPVRATSIPLKC